MICLWGISQDIAYNDKENLFKNAYDMAYEGNHNSAKIALLEVLSKDEENLNARSLMASIYSWEGEFEKARDEFNKITSKVRDNRNVWISAIKNELYANNNATALGLINKALYYLKNDTEVERLKELVLERIENQKYPELGWFNQNSEIKRSSGANKPKEEKKEGDEVAKVIKPKTPLDKEELKNKVGIRNSFIIYDQRYDPMIYSSISLKHQTKYGSIIPRINYSNRLGRHGIQYDVSLYPKLAKKIYAFLNYGYSKASIYPSHKLAGDVYFSLPGAIELSGGGRYIIFDTRNVSVLTNSLGHYRGNYYFSLRSYITPRPNNLTKVSGNLLVRKYLKDGENYLGASFGMGYSPELRQLTAGDELLAETLLYIESQRLALEYQFTGKDSPNIYKTNIGVRRQELSYDTGNYFWAVSAGLTYSVKF
ncbi:YaiO family outer membrane protein [Saonia flava]|uniref:YaiO family outer membrane protein n=1 Tax=Saonia flava TaxID=523696 RepID=A0A846QS84_9FLAO|nr:YaiO family outer membrane beta-barrel protein [Saonia flava]NJB69830.1 YaiO family outer membrane protein [Saonia flava]